MVWNRGQYTRKTIDIAERGHIQRHWEKLDSVKRIDSQQPFERQGMKSPAVFRLGEEAKAQQYRRLEAAKQKRNLGCVRPRD